jgi:hypothetical protein
MPFTREVNGTLLDFATAGALLFGMGLLFVPAARKMTKHRVAIAIVLVPALLYVWAELAFGILTIWGS